MAVCRKEQQRRQRKNQIRRLILESTPDAYLANVAFQADFDGTDGDTAYTADGFGRTGTFGGNAQLSNGYAKMGNTSALFDGTTDSITFPVNPRHGPGYNSFTIETTVKFGATNPQSTTQVICGVWPGASHYSWRLEVVSGVFTVVMSTTGSNAVTVLQKAVTWAAGDEVDIAVVLDRGAVECRFYENGVLADTETTAVAANSYFHSPTSGSMEVGGSTVTTNYLDGYVDNLRLTHGVARYTGASYTVPSAWDTYTFVDRSVPDTMPDVGSLTESAQYTLGQDDIVGGGYFNSDGTEIYVNIDTGASSIYKATLATAYTPEALVNTDWTLVGSTPNRGRDMVWMHDGFSFLLAPLTQSSLGEVIFEANPDDEAFSIGSNLAGSTRNNTAAATSPRSVDIAADGSHMMYVTNGTGLDIYYSALSDPWDPSSVTSWSTFAPAIGDIAWAKWSTDGTKLYALTVAGATLCQYNLSTPWDISTASTTADSTLDLETNKEPSQLDIAALIVRPDRIITLGYDAVANDQWWEVYT